MENYCLGKALPRHKLMYNLMSDLGKKNVQKITTGTQTNFSEMSNQQSCCCLNRKPSQIRQKPKKFTSEIEKRKMDQQYQNLLASIRERVVLQKDDEISYCTCTCSDGWSDHSAGEGDTIPFPKETRNAINMLMAKNQNRQVCMKASIKYQNLRACPGIAERTSYDQEKRLINADEMVAKINSKLSKNKLVLN